MPADLSIGSDSLSGELFGDLSYNRLKNHWRQADPITALTDPQPGMICSAATAEKLYHYQAAAWFEIVQGDTPLGNNIEIIWGDNSDASIQYDEVTNDALIFGIPVTNKRGLIICDMDDVAAIDVTAGGTNIFPGTLTQPLVAIVDADYDSFISFTFGADDRPQIELYSAISSSGSIITQSGAENVAVSTDLRIGLDESMRNLIICDRGDIATDFGLAASTHPQLYFYDNAGVQNLHINYTAIDFRGSSGVKYIYTNYRMDFSLESDFSAAAGVFQFISGVNKELTDDNGEQSWMYLGPRVKQTLTAAYVGFLMDLLETSAGDASAGSGYNALMALRLGGDDRFVVESDGTVRFPEVGAGATRWGEIKQSIAEGIATASDLRIGLDESLRRLIVCDRGDIDTDFGLTAAGDPQILLYDKDGTYYLTLESKKLYSTESLTMRGTFLAFELSANLNAGNAFRFDGIYQLRDANAEQAWMCLEPQINQTGTANYVGFLMDVTEVSIGNAGYSGSPGYNALMALRVEGYDRFVIERDGTVRFPEPGGGSTIRWSEIVQSMAEGIPSASDLRIGLDESLRSLHLLDKADIAADLGQSAQTYPTFYLWHTNATTRLYYNVFGFNSNTSWSSRAVNWTFAHGGDISPGTPAFHFHPVANYYELIGAAGEAVFMGLEFEVDQSGTAGYVGFLMEVTETNLGSGDKELVALRVGGNDRFTISNTGEVRFYDEMIYVLDTQVVTDPPTDAELDGIYTSPAAVGEGWWTFLQNTSSVGVVYIIMSTGTSWEYVALTTAV